jgi:hypothetical protein
MKKCMSIFFCLFSIAAVCSAEGNRDTIHVSYGVTGQSSAFEYVIQAADVGGLPYRLTSERKVIETGVLTNVANIADLGRKLIAEFAGDAAKFEVGDVDTNSLSKTLTIEYRHGIYNESFSVSSSDQELVNFIGETETLRKLLRDLSRGKPKKYRLWDEYGEAFLPKEQ